MGEDVGESRFEVLRIGRLRYTQQHGGWIWWTYIKCDWREAEQASKAQNQRGRSEADNHRSFLSFSQVSSLKENEEM